MFVALHQDGSTNPNARGASVGYPTPTIINGDYADLLKAYYTLEGWPGGWRPDNYTHALRNYYGYRRINADVKVLLEHGFATNRNDEDWMWDNADKVVNAHVRTITHWLGVPEIPTYEDDDMPHVWEDTNDRKTWLCQGNRARVAADGNGNPTGRAMAEALGVDVLAYPNAATIVAELYDIV